QSIRPFGLRDAGRADSGAQRACAQPTVWSPSWPSGNSAARACRLQRSATIVGKALAPLLLTPPRIPGPPVNPLGSSGAPEPGWVAGRAAVRGAQPDVW